MHLLKHKGKVATCNANLYNIKSELYGTFEKIKQITQNTQILFTYLGLFIYQ